MFHRRREARYGRKEGETLAGLSRTEGSPRQSSSVLALVESKKRRRDPSAPGRFPFDVSGPPQTVRLLGLVVKASVSRAEDPGFESRFAPGVFPGRVIPVTSKLALQWLS